MYIYIPSRGEIAGPSDGDTTALIDSLDDVGTVYETFETLDAAEARAAEAIAAAAEVKATEIERIAVERAEREKTAQRELAETIAAAVATTETKRLAKRKAKADVARECIVIHRTGQVWELPIGDPARAELDEAGIGHSVFATRAEAEAAPPVTDYQLSLAEELGVADPAELLAAARLKYTAAVWAWLAEQQAALFAFADKTYRLTPELREHLLRANRASSKSVTVLDAFNQTVTIGADKIDAFFRELSARDDTSVEAAGVALRAIDAAATGDEVKVAYGVLRS